MEPRDLKSCGCGKHRGGLRALADPVMSVPLLGICGQALPSQVCGGRPKPDLGGGGSWETHPVPTHSAPTVATISRTNFPLHWELAGKGTAWQACGTPQPLLSPSPSHGKVGLGEAVIDVSQARTEHPWTVGAPPAGCGDGAGVPSSHPASPEGRAWLPITQIITS